MHAQQALTPQIMNVRRGHTPAAAGLSAGDEEAVSQAFATAVSLHAEMPRGWLLWALFYDRAYRTLEKRRKGCCGHFNANRPPLGCCLSSASRRGSVTWLCCCSFLYSY